MIHPIDFVFHGFISVWQMLALSCSYHHGMSIEYQVGICFIINVNYLVGVLNL